MSKFKTIKKAVKNSSKLKPKAKRSLDVIDHDQKTMRFELRLTGRQQEMIAAAAVILGFKNPTDYVRQYIHENSVRIIKDQAILEIAENDRKRFIEEIQTTGQPGNALKRAVKYYQKTIAN